MPLPLLFLSQEDIQSLQLDPSHILSVIESALIAHYMRDFEMPTKVGVHPTHTHPANFLHSMPGYLKSMGVCGMKWVGGFANNSAKGYPNITGIEILNDCNTGVPLAVMDCTELTGIRTTAVSSIAAKLCAVANPKILALVGCGFQGSKHLWMFSHLFRSSLITIRLLSRRRESAEKLRKESLENFGLAGKVTVEVCDDTTSCFKDADIICTCTPGDDYLISPEDMKEGMFGVGIEGGCAYFADALQSADLFVVDDIELVKYFDEIGKERKKIDGTPDPEFPGGLPNIYATLGEIICGAKSGRQNDKQKIVACPIGMSLCDIALMQLAYVTAKQKGIGQCLQL